LARTLHAVSPLEVIGRGYAVISAATTGAVVSSVAQLARGDRVEARLADGSLYCTVDSIRKGFEA
jgi:exodeoxyribonuclease VII large subunit